MKTKEFIERVKEFGYEIVKQNNETQVWGDEYDLSPKARILETKSDRLILNSESHRLIKLCLEYAETPISEREEEKLYTVILPDSEPDYPTSLRYVLYRTDSDKIAIVHAIKSKLDIGDMFHLTEAEIKRNHEYLWQFAKEVME